MRFKIRLIHLAWLGLPLLAAAAEPPAGLPAPPPDFAALRLVDVDRLVVERNRALVGARRATEAAEAGREVAAGRPNPTLSLNTSGMSAHRPAGGGNLDTVLRIDQPIERGGKRELRLAVADSLLAASRADETDTARQQRLLARQAYFDLKAAEDKARLAAESAKLAREVLSKAELRQQAGDLAPAEVARIRTDTLKAEADARQARVDRQRSRLALAQALALEAEAPRLATADPWPRLDPLPAAALGQGSKHAPPSAAISGQEPHPAAQSAAVSGPKPDPVSPSAAASDSRPDFPPSGHPAVDPHGCSIYEAFPDSGKSCGPAGTELRPDVLAARRRLAAAEAGIDLAKSQRVRDVTLGAQIERDASQGSASSPGGNLLGFGVSIPLFTGYDYRGEIRRAHVDRDTARDELERVRATAAAEVAQAAFEAEQLGERARRLRDEALPAARQASAAVQFAFAHGAASALDVIDARRSLHAVETDTANALADAAKARAAWAAAVNRPELP